METELVKTIMQRMGEIGERVLVEPLGKVVDEACASLPDALRAAGLPDDEIAICVFVVRVTLAPRTLARSHVTQLMAAGFNDREAHDVVNVCCCVSYMNRLADGLGVALEPRKEEWARELMGEEAFARHVEWAR